MAVRRYRVVRDAQWPVWVEGEPGHWQIRCPCHGLTGHYDHKPAAIRAARYHRRRRPANTNAGGDR
jgi:hypothetical protein